MNPPRHLSARPVCAGGIIALLLALFGAPISPARAAATNTNALASSGAARCLIMVETSANMRRNAPNLEATLVQLLVSGLNGQLNPGDTLGLWTYNEKLNAGSFPLELWRTEHRQRIAGRAVDFLRKQKYEKRSVPEVALGPMQQVIKASGKITVVIMSDGEKPMSGTPFDTAINDYFKKNFAAQRKVRMPFVTILRAVNGEFIGHTVNLAPFTPEYPPFPPEPKSAVAKVAPLAAPAKPAPRVGAPLIVIGPKPETDPTPSVVLPPPELGTAPPPQVEELPLPGPGELGRVLVVRELPMNHDESPVTSALVSSGSPATPAADATAATIPPPRVESVETPAALAATSASPPPSTPPVPPASSLASAATTKPPPSAEIPPASPALVDTVSPAPTPPPTATTVAPDAPALSPPAATPATATEAVVLPVAQATAVVPANVSGTRLWLLVAGAVLLGVALGVGIMLLQRARTPRHSSLITESMDRHRKVD